MHNKINMESGIYKIKNIVNCKIYIGSAKSLKKRKSSHFNSLKNNKHRNNRLQKAFNKYGENNFKFEIIEYCREDLLIGREQRYLDNYNPEYNICKIAGSTLGVKPSKESLEKRIQSLTGYKHTDEAKENMRNATLKRMERDSEQILSALAKGRLYNKGKIFNLEYRISLSLAKTNGVIKPIKRICIDTEEEKIYDYKFLIRDDGFYIKSVVKCCEGLSKSHKNYIWKYA